VTNREGGQMASDPSGGEKSSTPRKTDLQCKEYGNYMAGVRGEEEGGGREKPRCPGE